MSVAEYTLLADAVGTSTNPGAAGQELPNFASRRLLNFDEMAFARAQFGSSDTSIKIAIEYSQDDGVTWEILIDKFDRDVPPKLNECSDWTPLPEAFGQLAGQDVLIRAMLYGGGTSTRVMYISLQVR